MDAFEIWLDGVLVDVCKTNRVNAIRLGIEYRAQAEKDFPSKAHTYLVLDSQRVISPRDIYDFWHVK